MKNVFVCIKNAFLQDVRYPCNFVFGMLTPLLSLIPLMITIQMFQRQSDLAWYLIGLIIWMYLTQIIWGNGVILKNEKQRGTLEQLFLLPKKLSFFVFSKSLYFVIKALISMIFVVLFCNFVYDSNIEVVKILCVILIGFPFYYSISIIISLFCLNVDYLFPVLQTILGVVMIFSGMTYDISLNGKLAFLNKCNIIYQVMLLARKSSSLDFVEIFFSQESLIIILGGVISFLLMIFSINRFITKHKSKGVF